MRTKTLSIYLAHVLKTSHWYKFHPSYLSMSPVPCHKWQRVFSSHCTPARYAGHLIVRWAASFWLQWTVAECTVQGGSPTRYPTKPREEYNGKCMLYNKIRSVQNTGTCYSVLDCFFFLLFFRYTPGSWQTSHGLESISRYSARIPICIVCNNFCEITMHVISYIHIHIYITSSTTSLPFYH